MIRGWLVRLNAEPSGGLRVDPAFLVASSDTSCFP